jgi:NAD(P)-dependent dehydrogenase (short-subunit alcohol dehydrogenase family)
MLDCRTCAITGANSGIGRETALALAQMRSNVVMVCRNRDKGETARREIGRRGDFYLPRVFAGGSGRVGQVLRRQGCKRSSDESYDEKKALALWETTSRLVGLSP